jgi:hypothetical protein
MGDSEPTTPLLVSLLEEAVKRAEGAAEKAEKAAKRPGYLLIAGFSFALVGAVLAFALEDSDAVVLGVSLQALGGVLFAAGALLIGAAAIGSMGGNDGADNSETVRRLGGLIAVVVGVVAVTALAIVTLTQLGDEKDSLVAVTTSAFGIISAVVGAYLGIKITGDTADKATREVKNAAVAEHEAHIARRQVAAMKETAKDTVGPEQAEAISAAAYGVHEEESARIARPPMGDRPS